MRRRPGPGMAGDLGRSWTRSFRVLYFFRVGFSAAWVALVAALASSTAPGATPGALAGILLACYPVSDAVATTFDLRANRADSRRWPQQVNQVAGVAAAGEILFASLSGLAAAITAFGIWAVVSGVIMAVLAVRRRRVLRGQWLMLISGAGSVFAGITFIGWTGTPAAGLAILAQYSADGALWYLLAGLWLLRSARPSTAVARSADVEDNDPRSSQNLVPRSREGVGSASQRLPSLQISAGPCGALDSMAPRRRRPG